MTCDVMSAQKVIPKVLQPSCPVEWYQSDYYYKDELTIITVNNDYERKFLPLLYYWQDPDTNEVASVKFKSLTSVFENECATEFNQLVFMTEDEARDYMSAADERAILILNIDDDYYELNGGTEAFDDLHLERYSDKERSQFVFLRNY